MLKRKCPICGCKEGQTIIDIEMKLLEGVPLPDRLAVVSCELCGFSFADTAATQNDYNDYYENYNMYSDTANVRTDLMQKICHNRYKVISKYIKKDANILDIGCGGGELLSYLSQKGYTNLYGMDPSQKSIENLLMSGGGCNGRIGNIFSEVPDDLEETFDVVICTMVLEHLYDVDFFVPKLQKYLKKNQGLLFIEVPAAEKFEHYVTELPNYFNQEHINYFSITSLDNLLGKNYFVRKNLMEESYGEIDVNPPEVSLMGIYQYNPKALYKMQKDTITHTSICNYIEKVKNRNIQVSSNIKELMNKNEKIIVWGTGSYAMQLMAKYPEINELIVCFIDNNSTKEGLELCGKKIYAPKKLLEDNMEYPILICCMHNACDIIKQIDEMEIKNQMIEG